MMKGKLYRRNKDGYIYEVVGQEESSALGLLWIMWNERVGERQFVMDIELKRQVGWARRANDSVDRKEVSNRSRKRLPLSPRQSSREPSPLRSATGQRHASHSRHGKQERNIRQRAAYSA